MEVCGSFVVINPYLILRNTCLTLKNGKIVLLAPNVGDVEDDLTIITHGFASLHTHLGLYPIRHTLFYGKNLDSWVTDFVWPWERLLRQEPKLSYYSALLALNELIHSGVTAVADMHFNEELIANILEEVGVKGDLCTAIMEKGVFDNFEEAVEENLSLIQSLQNKPGIAVRLGPCTPRALTPAQVKYVIDLAIELRVGIHMHAGEVYADNEYITKFFGLSMGDFFKYIRLGAVDTILAHGIWLLDGLSTLIGRPVVITHSPRSNMLLNNDLINVGRIIAEGVEVALAVDVAPTYSILDELRTFLYVQRPKSLDYYDIYRMITVVPYRSMGFGTGSLIVNEPADLAIWKINNKLGYTIKSKLNILAPHLMSIILGALAEGSAKLQSLYASGKLIIKDEEPIIPQSEVSKANDKIAEAIRDLFGKSASP